MARRNIRTQAALATTRIMGLRWDIAMRNAEWDLFSSDACAGARARLLAALETFCDRGDRKLPGSCFRWLSRSPRAHQVARQGSFQAHGVALRGHASDRVFFVTAIDIDPVPPPPTRRARRGKSDQRQLPLSLLLPTGGPHG